MRDWDVFRYLLAIHRHGGLSGAARALGVTHATVSRQLNRAETALGAKLFDRMPAGLSATAAGQVAIARAEAAEAELAALDLGLMDENRGAVCVTAPPLMMRAHLADDLFAFRAAHPGIRLTVLADNRVFNLHRREADVAIRVSRHPSESLWGRKVADQRAGYFATKAFLAHHAAAFSGGGGAVPVVSFSAWRDPVPAELLPHLPGAQSAVMSDDMLAGLELVKAGFGLTRVPFFIARTEPDLLLIDTLPMPSYAPVWMLTHPDMRRAPIVQLVMRFLGQRFIAATQSYLNPPA